MRDKKPNTTEPKCFHCGETGGITLHAEHHHGCGAEWFYGMAGQEARDAEQRIVVRLRSEADAIEGLDCEPNDVASAFRDMADAIERGEHR